MYLAVKGCELRVCRNPAVVVAVLHSAFSRHEELVLRKVEKVFGGRLAANERLPFAVQTGNLLFQLCLLQYIGIPGENGDVFGKKSPFLGIVYTGK